MLLDHRDGCSQLLKVFRKSLPKISTFCLILRRWEDLIRKGISTEWDNEGCFLLCLYRNGTKRGAFYYALRDPNILWDYIFFIPIPFLPTPFCCQRFWSAACVAHALQMFHCTQWTWQSFCYLVTGINLSACTLIICVAVFHHKNVGNQNIREFWNSGVWFKILICKIAMAELHFDYSSG